MSVTIRNARDSANDRRWIAGVYRNYLDDLAPLNTGIFPALGEIGHSEADQLARWFADNAAFPMIVLASGEPCGFAMVARASSDPLRRNVDYRMAEFFVARASRRRGVGANAVRLLLDRFAGNWEIVEYLRNPGAVQFWRRVVADYTGGQYREENANGEVRQYFTSGPRRSP
ncbi:MAG: GNAT family N-acetyltransferase [Steroidobacteraceae bacterium]